MSDITSATFSCLDVLWVTVGLLVTLPVLNFVFELDPLLPFDPEGEQNLQLMYRVDPTIQ